MYSEQSGKRSNYILPTLVLTVVIEIMGLGLVLPLLSALFMPGSDYFPIAPQTSLHTRYVYYSLAVVLWPIGAFFGTPYLGELSDKYGRKRILSVCLFMTGLGYALSAVSIFMGSLFLFFVCRLATGFFAGCYDIAQAAAADISTTPKVKARNMGWITFAMAIGLIVGPIISGFTTESSHIQWFSICTPFWIASGLAVLNTLLVLILLNETYNVNEKAKVQLKKIFLSFLFIFTDSRVKRLGIIFFMLNIGYYLFFSSMPLILNQKFHFNPRLTGVFFCFIGSGTAVSILFVQKKALKLFSLKKIYIITTIISSLFLIGSFVYPVLYGLWIFAFFVALFEILCYSSLLAMGSNAVTKDLQGRVMGGLGAVLSLSFIFSGMLLPFLSDINVLLPLLGAGAAYLISTFIMLGTKE